MSTLEFTSKGHRGVVVPFSIDGEPFEFTVPKSAALVIPAAEAGDDNIVQIERLLNWFRAGLLGPTQYERFRAKLLNAADPFDLEDLQDLIPALMKAGQDGQVHTTGAGPVHPGPGSGDVDTPAGV